MTFSIIAFDKNKSEYGIAICSAIPFIGKYAAFHFKNQSLIAAQGKQDPCTAYSIRNLLNDNENSTNILNYLKKNDPSFQRKQLAVLDLKKFQFFSYTGEDLKMTSNEYSKTFGDIIMGDNYIISGNCLLSIETLTNMENSFKSSASESLDTRLLMALKAGNISQADFRGRQSAALYYFRSEHEYPIRTIDVDEHKNPVEELERIFNLGTKCWQNVVEHCFFDMKFERKFKTINDFPDEIVKSINILSKPVAERNCD
ncbi:DUF1028 domain-containing protein [Fluviispira sanaruensis]|uniref:DUF1028 domain-containing protein n=1 Tax=Fluviispira sanaruensis TaxID=2493639 RepID=A0A4V0P2T4_FLUSA|nr:DUF1028 domain-containing protein [Fluviispira sanaruensis]BBH54337.1 DUF1028 domain-containing protein [Fluviispira sanaruensis]